MKYLACIVSLLFVQVSFAAMSDADGYREDRFSPQAPVHGKPIQVSAQCLVSGALVGGVTSDKSSRQDSKKADCMDPKVEAIGFDTALDRYRSH